MGMALISVSAPLLSEGTDLIFSKIVRAGFSSMASWHSRKYSGSVVADADRRSGGGDDMYIVEHFALLPEKQVPE